MRTHGAYLSKKDQQLRMSLRKDRELNEPLIQVLIGQLGLDWDVRMSLITKRDPMKYYHPNEHMVMWC